jgi:hypothetical protein
MTSGIGLALFIVVDAIVVYVVLKQVVAKRGGFAGFLGVARFANTAAEETKGYLAANYGGDTAALPGVLQGLVERLSQRATEQGVTLDRAMLKQFAATAVISLKAAPANDVRSAMESVS